MKFRVWLSITVSIFAIGLVLGLMAPPGIIDLLFESLTGLEELGGQLFSLSPIVTAFLIFVRNATILLFSFVLSPLLCVVPVLALLVNGAVISLVSALAVRETSLGFVLTGLLPHGVVEIPALLLGTAAALSFGFMAMAALFNKDQRGKFPTVVKRDIRFLAIALGLLLVAAFTETYLTPVLLS